MLDNHPPTFSKTSYSITINENTQAGHCFLKVEATSGDSVDKVNYFLGNGKDNHAFELNKLTGDLCTRKLVDREQQDKYELQVLANDGKFETAISVSIGMNFSRNRDLFLIDLICCRNSGRERQPACV